MSRRTERPYKVDGTGELARHSAAPGSIPEINGPVVQQEFTSLLRETCGPSSSATASAQASNGLCETAGVMLRELRRHVTGWLNYFGLSQAYRVIPELDQWVRRRVRMYYWKQWKRARTRRRQLIRLGIHPAEVFKATRSHRGYWFMAGTSIVQRALDNRWLAERGVPSLKQQWVEMH